MIRLNRQKRGIPYRIVWFSANPQFQLWPPTIYYQSPNPRPKTGLIQQPFHTYLSKIEGDPESWLTNMSSTTRNEIRQAVKVGVTGRLASVEEFLSFFNAFAQEKGIEGTSMEKLTSFGHALRLTVAYTEDRILAMHGIVVDQEAGRGRLLLSASARFADSAERTLVGKANRWLHWWDMTVISQEGLSVYDWGGYAKDTEDPAKQGINRFKEAFGGQAVEEFHYYPFYLSRFRD